MEDSTPNIKKTKKSQKDRVRDAQAWIEEVKRQEKTAVEDHMVIDAQKYSRYNQKRSIHMGISLFGEPFNTAGGRMHLVYGSVTLVAILLGSWLFLGFGVSKVLDAPNANPVQNLQFK